MEFVVLRRESVKVVRRGAAAVPVFFLSYPDFDDGEFYAVKIYIHVVQEGAEEYLFGVPVTSMSRARQSVSARVNEERVEGGNIATGLPSIFSGRRGNLNDDDMNKIREPGFDVDDDNLPNPENVPEPIPMLLLMPLMF